MEKSIIKKILRENLFTKLKETAPKSDAKSDGTEDKSKIDSDYSEVQRKLDGTLLKQSQVFAMAGLGHPDDATARSLNSKKLRKEPNKETGSIYQFDEKELAAIVKVINNPSSYLNVKK